MSRAPSTKQTMAGKGDSTPSSMSYLTPPPRRRNTATMAPPETPRSTRVVRVGSPTPIAPYGTWTMPPPGLGPSGAPAYAPYGAPWPATYDTRVTETIHVTVVPPSGFQTIQSRAAPVHKQVDHEAKNDPADAIHKREGRTGVPDHSRSEGADTTENPGTQHDDSKRELRLPCLSASSDVAAKAPQATKELSCSQTGGIRLSWAATLGEKATLYCGRKLPDYDEIGEISPAKKLRRKEATWDMRAGIHGRDAN